MSHTKQYDVPQAVALALTTQRIAFLRGLSDEAMATTAIRELLIDLIEDRVKLRQELVEAIDAIDHMRKAIAAFGGRYRNLLGVLDGRKVDGESDNE